MPPLRSCVTMALVTDNPLRGHPTTRMSEEAELQIPSLTKAAAACPVGPLERQILGEIDGQRTVAELAPRVGLGPAEACALVSRLAQLGAVVVTTVEASQSIIVDIDDEQAEKSDKDVDRGWE